MSQQVLLHSAATQLLTFLPAISLFLRDGRKRTVFIDCARSCAIQLYSPSWKSHVATPKPEEIFRIPGMYKLCQLSAVFSSHFLSRTLDKIFKNNFFLLPTQFGRCINAKKIILTMESPFKWSLIMKFLRYTEGCMGAQTSAFALVFLTKGLEPKLITRSQNVRI